MDLSLFGLRGGRMSWLRDSKPAPLKPQRRVVCEAHGWSPEFVLVPPPASECPACKAEESARQDETRDRYTVEHPLRAHSSDSLDARWERHLTEHATSPIPGSAEEEVVLEKMDEARFAAQAREARKSRRGGRIALQRIEEGELVVYTVPPRGRRGLWRVTP